MPTKRQFGSFFMWVGGGGLILWVSLWFMTLFHLIQDVETLCHFREAMGHLSFVSMGYIGGNKSEMVKLTGANE